MYAGRLAEQAPSERLFARPVHPYTRGLLASIPRLEDEPKTILNTIPGVVPGVDELPSGCRFANRCAYAEDVCNRAAPELADATPGHNVACHRWREIEAVALQARGP